MISFLQYHLLISVPFLAALFILAKIDPFRNRGHLILLYSLLCKTLIPAGFIRIPYIFRSHTAVNFTGTFEDPVSLSSNVITMSRSAINIEKAVSIIWIIGASVFLLISITSLLHLNRRVKLLNPCTDNLTLVLLHQIKERMNMEENVQLLSSETMDTSFIWYSRGWKLIVPSSLLNSSSYEKETILSHELAHIKRKDFLKFILLRITRNVFFFSPFVHYVLGDILNREEIETDTLALQSCNIQPEFYGKTLLKHAGSSSNVLQYTPAFILNNRKRRLRMRLKDLFIKEKVKTIGVTALAVISVFLLISLINFSPTEGLALNTADRSFSNPLPNGRITMLFGQTKHPLTHKPYFHKGIDIAAEEGTAISASADGIVIEANYNEAMGNYLVIQHESNFQTVYTHLKDTVSRVNDQVRQGETVAHVGNTGVSTGPHLHFELHKEGGPVNPEDHIAF